MAQRKHERTRDRVSAIQVLYTGELQHKTVSELLEGGLALVALEVSPATEDEASMFGRIEEGALTDYALGLLRGVQDCQEEIDDILAAASENWALARMPIVDRSILRLAVYEMKHVDDVPVSVSINEAVELAKDFGGEEDSPRFVNGVLGRIARQMQATEDKPGSAADAAVHPRSSAVSPLVGASAAAAVVQAGV